MLLSLVLPTMMMASRSCTGWGCVCVTPYGFGEDGNKICLTYGPSLDAAADVIAMWNRFQNTIFTRANKPLDDAETKAARAARVRAMKRRNMSMEKKYQKRERYLEFEDQCRMEEHV